MRNIEVLSETSMQTTVIKVIGVGGGGGNAVQYMIEQGASGVEFIVANTDQQALKLSNAHLNVQLGDSGLGAGAKPEVGAELARQRREQIKQAIQGSNLLFITAGMGGGTGTGAAPVVAQVAKELGILTVGVVTKPFSWEGKRRMTSAIKGIEELRKYADCMLVVLNEKLEKLAGPETTMKECFAMSNEVLYKACIGIADIIHTMGQLNVDFADVETTMSYHGSAIIGSATASGPDRAIRAAEQVINCPLLETSGLSGARGMLLNISSSQAITMHEMNRAMEFLGTFTHEDCNIIFGMTLDESLGDELRITVVATGLDNVSPSSMVSPMAPMGLGPMGGMPTPMSPIENPVTGSAWVTKASDMKRDDALPVLEPMEEVPMSALPDTTLTGMEASNQNSDSLGACSESVANEPDTTHQAPEKSPPSPEPEEVALDDVAEDDVAEDETALSVSNSTQPSAEPILQGTWTQDNRHKSVPSYVIPSFKR